MKPQQELYQALEKAEKIIRDNNLFDTLNNASKMATVISTMAERADEPNDLTFKHVALDVIGTYINLLDETIDDLQAIAYAVNAVIDFGLMEPEAEEGEDDGYHE